MSGLELYLIVQAKVWKDTMKQRPRICDIAEARRNQCHAHYIGHNVNMNRKMQAKKERRRETEYTPQSVWESCLDRFSIICVNIGNLSPPSVTSTVHVLVY